eukprot:1694687-Amphidinium_carterae.1
MHIMPAQVSVLPEYTPSRLERRVDLCPVPIPGATPGYNPHSASSHTPPPPMGFPRVGFLHGESSSTGHSSLTTTNVVSQPQRVELEANLWQDRLELCQVIHIMVEWLNSQHTVRFQLIKAWKEWVLAVQLTVLAWSEHAPPYWQTVLNRATALYGQYCSMSPAQRAMYETNIHIVHLWPGQKMLKKDAVETRLTEPKTINDCVTRLRTYLQDAHVAIGILEVFAPVHNVQLKPIRVCTVMRTFVKHVCSLNSTLRTKIVILGEVNENMPITSLLQWASHVLGFMAEKVNDDKQIRRVRRRVMVKVRRPVQILSHLSSRSQSMTEYASSTHQIVVVGTERSVHVFIRHSVEVMESVIIAVLRITH